MADIEDYEETLKDLAARLESETLTDGERLELRSVQIRTERRLNFARTEKDQARDV